MEKKVISRFIVNIFFSNFFLILLSIALNIETNIKIGLPFNSIAYYAFISTITVLFYLYAYRIPKSLKSSNNPRTQFYITHRKSVRIYTFILAVIALWNYFSDKLFTELRNINLEMVDCLIFYNNFILWLL